MEVDAKEQAQAEVGKLRIPESECHRTRASKSTVRDRQAQHDSKGSR